MTAAPRTAEQRRRDVLALLASPNLDGWVASAPDDGPAHMVPLSVAWVEEHLVIAIERTSPTARNIEAAGRARLGFGSTRDVVMVDAELVMSVAVARAAPTLAAGFAAQADWDPRGTSGYRFLVLAPRRIQAWREAGEIAGRTLMVGGHWKT
ncbi:MAG: pyridoxamine 5'-phosphate oxidase family protein [Thermoleophilia bacterium]|nr:pyridoxamine 5'-phosphate oxidase family protein [Thermoleophilia bacterium]